MTTQHIVVSREEWLAARMTLLAQERALTQRLDALRAARRQLPWVRNRKVLCLRRPQRALFAWRSVR
jgi:predicted dithiol-disulfide oxidoreductase (DUF899 family)